MKQQIVFIGNCSKNGIYKYQFEKGKLIKIYYTNDFERCTYLVNNNSYLYTVREVEDKENRNNGYIIAYKKDENQLKRIDKRISYGKGPCHIEMNEKLNLIFVSNYVDGAFVILKINKDGTMGNKIYWNIENEKKSHVHCAKTSIDNKYLFLVDLGEDSVIAFEISEDRITEISRVKFKKGTQPRHIAINGNKIYVITEITCELYTLKFDNNELNIIDVISILPINVTLKEDFTGCAIKISKDFRNMYVTIRGYNGISVYKIKKEKLIYMQNISCKGNLPRDLEIDKSGKYVLVANQDSNEISIFRRNPITGKLSYKNKEKIESPTCIIFE